MLGIRNISVFKPNNMSGLTIPDSTGLGRVGHRKLPSHAGRVRGEKI